MANDTKSGSRKINQNIELAPGARNLTTTGNITAGVFYGDGSNLTGISTASANDALITITAGAGLTGGGGFTVDQAADAVITVSHSDTSSQASVANTAFNVIQSITLDTYGHITAVESQDIGTAGFYVKTTGEVGTGVKIGLGSLTYQTLQFFAGTGLSVVRTDNEIQFSAPNATNWNTAYTYSQVGHLPLTGGTLTGQLIIGSASAGTSPTLRVNTPTSSTFVHIQESIAANLTTGQHVINVIGKETNTKNSGYIGYYWAGNASNDNFVTIGHWGADDLFRVYGNGNVTISGTLSASGYNKSNWDTAFGWGNHAGLYASVNHTHIISPISETAVPSAGIYIQAGPGSNNTQGWTHPYGTRLSAITGAGRSFEIMSTTYPNGELAMRTLNSSNVWDAWKTIIDSSNISSQSVNYAVSAGTANNALALSGYALDGATSVATRIFNNKGQVHGTYTDFNTAMTPGPNYLQAGTNGPTGTASQWYGFMLGLGGQYNTETGDAGSYASQLYWNRYSQGGFPYLYARDMEGGTWGSWRKMSAGYADTAGSANSVAWGNISSIPSLWYQSGSWYADFASYSFVRENGVTMSGGSEFVLMSRSGQGHVLIDGSYWAGEGNGFYSLNTSNQYTSQVGFARDSNAFAAFNTTVSAVNDVRAPIFYDSNNTGYYVDPESGTNLKYLNVEGNWGGSPFGSSHAQLNVTGSYASITQRSTAGTLAYALHHINNEYYLYVGRGATNGTDWDWALRAYPNQDGNYVEFRTSARAPIFYDSDNTGYYVNPAGQSNVDDFRAAAYRGNANVGGTGTATWHPDGIYVGSTQWLYGAQYRNGSTTSGQGWLYIDTNYGQSVVGLYTSTRYQGVWAMGDAYKLPADGTSIGNLYGMAWSHPNAGGVAGNLNTHGLLVTENGSFLAAVSGSIRSRDDMRAPIFYDSNDTGYYLDPASTSNLNGLNVGGNAVVTSGNIGSYTTLGINTQFLGSGTSNVSFGYSTVIRNENGSGGNTPYAPILHLAASDTMWQIAAGHAGSTSLRWRSGYAGNWSYSGWWDVLHTGLADMTATGSFRAPIFYDSDNTGYYLNPNSESKIIKLWINNGGANGVSWASGLNMGDSSNYWNLIQDAGTARQRNYGTGGYDWYNNTASTQIMVLSNGGSLSTSGDMRAPIFYDTNNTGYYLDPTSASSLRTVGSWRADSAGWDGEFAGKIQYHSDRWYFQYTNLFHFRNAVGSNVVEGDNSGNFWAYGSMRTPILYDENNTGYYVDPASTSNLNSVNYAGQIRNSGSGYKSYNLHGMVGDYDQNSTSDKIIWTIGDSWNSIGGMYGIGYSYGSGYGHHLVFRNNGTPYHRISFASEGAYFTGTVTASGDIVAFSDERTKENVKTIDNALDKVLSLRGVEFNKIGETNKSIGVIAQEVEKVLPEVVKEHEMDGMKTVAYGNIVGVLIEAIKDQQKQIEELKAIVYGLTK